MIDVPMRDHDSQKARISAVFQAGSRREQACIRFFGVQRLTEIEENPFAATRKLNAGAADFVRPSPNTRPELVARIWSVIVRRASQCKLSNFGSKIEEELICSAGASYDFVAIRYTRRALERARADLLDSNEPSRSLRIMEHFRKILLLRR
jgi:hypothetical protein